jgi:excisionase family DNA binding protein
MIDQIKEKRFLDVEAVADYLSLSPYTIRTWVKTGRIPFVKLGRSVRFDLRELDIWLKRKKVPCIGTGFISSFFSCFSRIY